MVHYSYSIEIGECKCLRKNAKNKQKHLSFPTDGKKMEADRRVDTGTYIWHQMIQKLERFLEIAKRLWFPGFTVVCRKTRLFRWLLPSLAFFVWRANGSVFNVVNATVLSHGIMYDTRQGSSSVNAINSEDDVMPKKLDVNESSSFLLVRSI